MLYKLAKFCFLRKNFMFPIFIIPLIFNNMLVIISAEEFIVYYTERMEM